jgi:hypothetical protein
MGRKSKRWGLSIPVSTASRKRKKARIQTEPIIPPSATTPDLNWSCRVYTAIFASDNANLASNSIGSHALVTFWHLCVQQKTPPSLPKKRKDRGPEGAQYCAWESFFARNALYLLVSRCMPAFPKELNGMPPPRWSVKQPFGFRKPKFLLGRWGLVPKCCQIGREFGGPHLRNDSAICGLGSPATRPPFYPLNYGEA